MEVSKNDRLVNYSIDTIVTSVLVLILVQIPVDFIQSAGFPILLYFLYYFGMELAFNRTLGKLITHTQVISVKNNRPQLIHILARTILRLVPFDAFSYLMGSEQGIHDALSQTKLVKIQAEV